MTTLRESVRASLHAGMTPLAIMAEVLAELQREPLPMHDVMRTVVGAIGEGSTAAKLGVFLGELQSWCIGGVEWVVPPEHHKALRALALRLGVGIAAAGSEGA